MEHKKEKKIDTDAYTINKAIVVLKVHTKLLNYSNLTIFLSKIMSFKDHNNSAFSFKKNSGQEVAPALKNN
jgi:hypothetical protein